MTIADAGDKKIEWNLIKILYNLVNREITNKYILVVKDNKTHYKF